VAGIGSLQAYKKHRFVKWRGDKRREALSISERSQQGAEASCVRDVVSDWNSTCALESTKTIVDPGQWINPCINLDFNTSFGK